MPTNSSKTGHEGFDFWMDEYSNCIQEVEDCLHVRSTTASITNSKRQQDATIEFLNRAKKILKSLAMEAQTVPEDDFSLQQELLDVYRACEMQLETYESLCRRTDLFQPTPSHTIRGGNTTKTTSTTTSSPSEAALRSSLFAATASSTNGAVILKNNTSGNNNNQQQQQQQHQQNRAQANTQGRVLKQNLNIQAALSSLRETEQVARGITSELHTQREKLVQTKGNVGELSSMTQRAKSLLNSMNTPWWQKW
jgi:hypothetical protein